jgi:endoglucanase
MTYLHRSRPIAAAALWLSILAGCSTDASSETVSGTRDALTIPGLFFQGNNFSGAERGFGASIEESWGPAIPGVEGSTHTWPTPTDNTLPAGMNIVRLPFQWERLQPALGENFDPAYLAKLHSTAEAWRNVGAAVLLDVHNYAYYKLLGRGTEQPGQHLGTSEVPSAAFADLWRRLALEFGSASMSSPFIFGLMNEPHDLEVATWVDAAQRAIDAIRATGAKNLIFTPGADWTTANDFSWSENKTLLQTVTDPENNFAIEVHQYYDGTCTPTCYVDKLAPFEDWAVANQRSAYLGELDLTDAAPACHEAFAKLIEHLHSRAAGSPGGVWIGYTYWQGADISDALPLLAPHLPATCANGSQDGGETDQDCGGTCLRCPDAKLCTHDYDCQSGSCLGNVCSQTSPPDAGGASAGGGGAGIGGATTGGAGNAAAGADAIAGTPSHGGSQGAGFGGSGPGAGAGGSAAGGGAGAGAGVGSAGAPPGTAGRRASAGDAPSGCGCRLGASQPRDAWAISAALLGLVCVRRRRMPSVERRRAARHA